MCGIAGTIGGTREQAEQMAALLSHRGPDFQGIWSENNVHLCHRLLAIRDTSSRSRQPYTRPNSPWILSFNGQIYNTDKLKGELGIAQTEDLDTIVLFSLIEKDGWDFYKRAFGMYAIALYNTHERKLRLYRDPSGQKPLYYTEDLAQFSFASEIHALTKTFSVPAVADNIAVTLGIDLGYVPGRRTIFSNIKQVMPGEMVSIDERGSVNSHERFVTLAQKAFEGVPRDVIRQTMSEHLQSKQKIALNLSGGMDSSVMLHEAVSAGHTVHTYTTRFVDASDELNEDARLATKLAEQYGTEHTTLAITKEMFLSHMRSAYETVETPDYNISLPAYAALAVQEGARGDGNRVVLTGDGGDELFAGYSIFRKASHVATQLEKYGQLYNLARYIRSREYWDFADPVSFFLSERRTHKKIHVDDISRELRADLPPSWESRTPNAIKDLLFLYREFWLAPENFVRGDKLFMHESLELRAPFAYEPLRAYFDARLTEADYLGPDREKHFFRSLYDGVLPNYITRRPVKSGWRAPVTSWWDKRFASEFRETFGAAPTGGSIVWPKLAEKIKDDVWPGKLFFAYYSLARLSTRFNVVL